MWLFLVIVGIVVSVVLFAFAGALFDARNKEGAWPFIGGLALLIVCCICLFCWNIGAISTTWWALDKNAPYRLIQQTEIDSKEGIWVVVLQSATDNSYWCVRAKNKLLPEGSVFQIVPTDTGTLKIIPISPTPDGKPVMLPVEKQPLPNPPIAIDPKETKKQK